MMLESLFARAGQEQAFLWLMAEGFLLGALLHLSDAVVRRQRLLGHLAEMLTGLCAAVMILRVLMRFGGGVRAYGLLGIIIGLLLYWAGLSRLMDAVGTWMTKVAKRLQKNSRRKEGFSSGDAEVITTQDALRKE